MADVRAPFLAAFTDEPARFLTAARASTARGWRDHHEGYLPYPLHEAFAALGLRRSLLGRPVFALLILGAIAGFFMQWWMMVVDWPIFISGKPFNSWPAYVVITFESGVLLAAVGTLALLLGVFCRLRPDPCTLVLRQRCTDDTFALAIALGGDRDEQAVRAFFAEQGLEDIERFDTLGREPVIPPAEPAAQGRGGPA